MPEIPMPGAGKEPNPVTARIAGYTQAEQRLRAKNIRSSYPYSRTIARQSLSIPVSLGQIVTPRNYPINPIVDDLWGTRPAPRLTLNPWQTQTPRRIARIKAETLDLASYEAGLADLRKKQDEYATLLLSKDVESLTAPKENAPLLESNGASTDIPMQLAGFTPSITLLIGAAIAFFLMRRQ